MKRRTALPLAMAAVIAVTSTAFVLATPGSGVTGTLLQRATTNARIALKTKPGALHDVVVQHVAVQPGGFSGWHSHPGPKLGAVKSGTVAYYTVTERRGRRHDHGGEGGTPHCTVQFFSAGDAFYVPANEVHNIRNEGAVTYEDYSTFVIPTSLPVRNDEPAPDAFDCPR
jgi:quercetin dioxygenase-like cupin family protein